MLVTSILLTLVHIFEPITAHTFTLMNEDESTVRLKQNIWKPGSKLHFKMTSNGHDGTVFTAINQQNDQMKLEIKNGRFKLYFDDKYHEIEGLTNLKVQKWKWNEIKIEEQQRNLVVSLDHLTTILPLVRKRHWLVENWKEVTMGVPNENTVTSSTKSMVGCIELQLQNGSGILDDYADQVHAISNTCIDACAVQSCENGGICLNFYNHAVCDCRTTGYQEDTCDEKAPAIQLNRRSYLKLIRDRKENSKNEVSIRFKTREPEGILLNESGDRDMLIIELHNSSIFVTMNFIGGTMRMNIGEDLNDGQWHYFRLSRAYTDLEVKLDDETDLKSKFYLLNDHIEAMMRSHFAVSFGGVEDAKRTSSLSKQNFSGCLQQIYYDDTDVVKTALTGNDVSIMKKGDILKCNT